MQKLSSWIRASSIACVLLAVGAMFNPSSVHSQNSVRRGPILGITVRGGMFFPRAKGPLFDVMQQQLDFTPSNLRGQSLGLELLAQASSRIQVVGGWEQSLSEAKTQALDPFNDPELNQTTSYNLKSSFFGGIRLFAFPRTERKARTGKRLNPYLIAGGGRSTLSIDQEGEFPDIETGEPFKAHFQSENASAYAFAGLGTEFSLPRSFFLSTEIRFRRGRVTPDQNFYQFESIDVTGVGLTVGLTMYW
jgi:hypothetical protein